MTSSQAEGSKRLEFDTSERCFQCYCRYLGSSTTRFRQMEFLLVNAVMEPWIPLEKQMMAMRCWTVNRCHTWSDMTGVGWRCCHYMGYSCVHFQTQRLKDEASRVEWATIGLSGVDQHSECKLLLFLPNLLSRVSTTWLYLFLTGVVYSAVYMNNDAYPSRIRKSLEYIHLNIV